VASRGPGSQRAGGHVHVIALNKTERAHAHTHKHWRRQDSSQGGGEREEGIAIKFAYKLASKQFRNVFMHRPAVAGPLY
jgi:hypothetical protein